MPLTKMRKSIRGAVWGRFEMILGHITLKMLIRDPLGNVKYAWDLQVWN